MIFNEKTNHKSILLIAHSYKPFLNPRAFRWTSIAEEFAQRGITVDVVTSWQPGLAREEKINGVNVFRVGGSMIEKLRAGFRSTDKNNTARAEQFSNKKKSFIKSAFKKTMHFIHDNSWKKLYWPDYACMWKKPAIENALHLLDIENYDAMITVSDPFTSHLVGYEIKKQNPDLHWMVDIGDPFCFRQGTQANNHTIYKNRNYKVESEIFSKADVISVTNENTQIKYAELFSESAGKIKVIPPMIANSDSSVVNQFLFPEDDKIRLVFVGTLYKKIRNPRFLLTIFEQLMTTELKNNLELHFYGGLNDTNDEFVPFKEYLNKSLFLHGLVPRETVLNAMNQGSVLINISNDNKYQLPSKLVEYMDTGNPILNIACIKHDISESFMSSYPSMLALSDTSENIFSKELEKCLLFLRNLPEKLSQQQCAEYTNKFNPENITSQYLKNIPNNIVSTDKAKSLQETL